MALGTVPELNVRQLPSDVAGGGAGQSTWQGRRAESKAGGAAPYRNKIKPTENQAASLSKAGPRSPWNIAGGLGTSKEGRQGSYKRQRRLEP